MPLTTTSLNAAVDAIANQGGWISMHTGDPGTTGANEVASGSYARQQTTWGAAANGQRTGSEVVVPIPGGVTISYFGIWSAKTGGTLLATGSLAPSESFGAAGSYRYVPTLAVTAS